MYRRRAVCVYCSGPRPTARRTWRYTVPFLSWCCSDFCRRRCNGPIDQVEFSCAQTTSRVHDSTEFIRGVLRRPLRVACPLGGPHSGYFRLHIPHLHIHTTRPNGRGLRSAGLIFPVICRCFLVQLYTRPTRDRRALERQTASRAIGTSHRCAGLASSALRSGATARSSATEEILLPPRSCTRTYPTTAPVATRWGRGATTPHSHVLRWQTRP